MKQYLKLRSELKLNDISIMYLEKILGRGHKYISSRMMGRDPWNMDEVYAIADMLNWPHDRIHELFPRRITAERRQ